MSIVASRKTDSYSLRHARHFTVPPSDMAWEIIRKLWGKVGAEGVERWATGSLFEEVCQTFGLIVRAK